MIKISIISPVFNDREMLRRNLESVLKQNYMEIEHIVVDGGSSDGTVQILKEYERKYECQGKRLVWISEKDNGIADAINKGSKISSGDLLMVMTDVFVSNGIITEIVNVFNVSNIDYCFGGVLYYRNGLVVRRWRGRIWNWNLGFMMATPTLCYKRSVWNKYGPYSEKYTTANDYDFQIKLLKDQNLKFYPMEKMQVVFYMGGSSNASLKNMWKSFRECQMILKSNNAMFPLFTNLCKSFIALCSYLFVVREKIELQE